MFTEVGISCILEQVIFLEKQNFITTGHINRVILTIATPLMINNLIRTLYNLTDGLYVAQLSAEDFAATAFIWPLNFLFLWPKCLVIFLRGTETSLCVLRTG